MGGSCAGIQCRTHVDVAARRVAVIDLGRATLQGRARALKRSVVDAPCGDRAARGVVPLSVAGVGANPLAPHHAVEAHLTARGGDVTMRAGPLEAVELDMATLWAW